MYTLSGNYGIYRNINALREFIWKLLYTQSPNLSNANNELWCGLFYIDLYSDLFGVKD